jgi:hypothetical protein
MVLHIPAEPAVFASRPREHGDEPPLMRGEIREAFARAQFAVGDVEKVRPPDDLPKRVPGVHMRGHVTGLAVQRPIVHRHRPVGRDREDEEQLLQIGAMVLVVPVGDAERRATGRQFLTAKQKRI